MEFILRKVKKKDGAEANEALGQSYEVYSRRTAPENVEGLWVLQNGHKLLPHDLFGILVAGPMIVALYNDCAYYVMTENGTTFDRIKP